MVDCAKLVKFNCTISCHKMHPTHKVPYPKKKQQQQNKQTNKNNKTVQYI